jgi:hypothetical protein
MISIRPDRADAGGRPVERLGEELGALARRFDAFETAAGD